MTTLAQSERAQLADLLDSVGPTAPTLCEGWDTSDLAAHLVVRESDPVAALGMFGPRLAGLTQRRMDRAAQRGSWTGLVDRIRQGPQRATISSLPGVDKVMNGLEYFIHHEDVRRAGEHAAGPRLLTLDHEQELWNRVGLLARLAFRKAPMRVVVENALDPEQPLRVGQPRRTAQGQAIVTLAGKPSELALYLSGRDQVAEVELIGEEDALAALQEFRREL